MYENDVCDECTRKCRQFVCCICSSNGVCECSMIAPDDDNEE